MMNKRYLKIVILLLSLIVVLGVLSVLYINRFSSKNDQNDDLIMKECSNLNLERMSSCLMNHISEGNCEDYTNFYEKEFHNLGVKTLRIVIPVDSSTRNGVIYLGGHTFLIAYNSNGYCKLDEENLNCGRYR